MVPKKNASSGQDANALIGFDAKETKILAAAFIASTAPGKVNYDVMASLTGNTAGTIKTYFPAIKNKAAEANEGFAAYIGMSGKTAPKVASASKKRKSPSVDDGDAEDDIHEQPKSKARSKKAKTGNASGEDKGDAEEKPIPKSGRGKKATAKKGGSQGPAQAQGNDVEAAIEEV